jgi:ubiquitin-activating enzyme E1
MTWLSGGGALVTVLEESPHGLESGDLVLLSRVQGIEGINDRPMKVQVKDRFSFELEHDHSFSLSLGTQNIKGGYVNQVKKPATVHFDSMADTLDAPGFIASFITKMGDRSNCLHLGFRALHEFRRLHEGELPQAGNMTHAEEVYALSCGLNEQIKLVESMEDFREVVMQLSLCARGQLSPMCALLGGVVAQETIKACSGKFMPITQWFYTDFAEALPDEPLPVEEVSPQECRYDGQIAVFGQEMQDKICRLNAFLVGAGAIGCEMLKNWAMMGVSCDAGGRGVTHVTDMDNIEKSNLSRQFLFRNADINRPKSVTAAAAAAVMNPSFRTAVYESKVAPDTEHIFSDDFYESLDFVCTALDNVQARLYVDQRCMFYHLPMLESGTLGTKGSTQVVVPCVTENYGASRDPVDEKSIPMCTLKFYPNLIEHTLQWARELFEEQYKQTPDDCNNYLNCATAAEFQTSFLANQQNVKLETLNRMYTALVESRPASIEDCIVWARLQFEDLFCNRIKQLLHTFPVDKLTSSGAPFWSGSKKPPAPLQFNAGDPLHMQFIVAAANMRAMVFGIPPQHMEEVFFEVLEGVSVPSFSPSDGVSIPTSDEESKQGSSSSSAGGYLDDIDAKCAAVLK